MGDKRFSPIPKQTKSPKKIVFRNMEVNLGIRVGYTGPCTLPNMYVQREQVWM